MARDQTLTNLTCAETVTQQPVVNMMDIELVQDVPASQKSCETQEGAVQSAELQSSTPDKVDDVPMFEKQAWQHVSPQRARSIVPMPNRLQSFVPPVNFGAVEQGTIYRSGYPTAENFGFLASLKLKTILTLVPEHLSEDYLEFIHSNGIRHVQIHIPANKDGVIHITPERMCMALSVVLERKNHPILIHCNRGKHRTGCVTACLRKIQSLSDEAAISEYRDYSYPKCRPDDVAFIRSFNPMALYPYAQAKGWTVTPPPEPSDDDWHLKQEPMVFSLSDIAALKVPEEPDSSL